MNILVVCQHYWPEPFNTSDVSADVFFNPTTEDNFPTVNLEAEACGTSVVTYDTGGCSETVKREGSSVVDGYEDAIRILQERLSLWCRTPFGR